MASEQEQLIKRRMTAAKHFADLGQNDKAVAQLKVVGKVLVEQKNYPRAIQVCKKILQLEPNSEGIAAYMKTLENLDSGVSSSESPPKEVSTENPTTAKAEDSKVVEEEEVRVVGVPWMFIAEETIAAIEALQLPLPSRDDIYWDRLPAVSEEAVLRAASKREDDLEKSRMKSRTKVRSAFSDEPAIQVGTGFLQQAKKKQSKSEPSVEEAPQESSSGVRKSRGNKSLADSIRRRLQGGG